jgi:hypothetical protein
MSVYPIADESVLLRMDREQLIGEVRRLNEYIKWRREHVADLTTKETEPGEYRAEFVRQSEELRQLRERSIVMAPSVDEINAVKKQVADRDAVIIEKEFFIAQLERRAKTLEGQFKAASRKLARVATAEKLERKAVANCQSSNHIESWLL